MNHDLIERYVYSVTKRMDRKQRRDVSLELQGLIEDMLEERCCGREPDERDVRIVLTELGTPQALARQYDADKDKCLIGQPYYTTYKYVLKLVLLCIVAGLTIAHGILGLLEPVRPFEAVAGWINSLWNCLFAAFSFVTLLFAFFQRRGIRVSESFNFDDLPPVPRHSKEISKWESICGIGFSVAFMVLFVFTPELFCVLYEGKMLSLFELDTVRQTWFIVVAFTVCGIGREVIQLMERQYNKKVRPCHQWHLRSIGHLVADGI